MARLPVVGQDGGAWGTILNEFLEVAHNADGTLSASPGSGGYASAHLVRYVDYLDGSDANAGLSPTSAYKTINACIDELSTTAAAEYTEESVGGNNHLGIGTVYLMPGDHQIGSEPITIPFGNYIDLVGFRSGMHGARAPNSGARIVSSSNAITAMLVTGEADKISYGTRISGVTFVVTLATNTALTSCIRTLNNDYIEVDHCTFRTHDSAGASDIVAIDLDSSAGNMDNAWFRINNNWCARLAFFRAQSGPNFNRGDCSHNLCFYDGGTAGTTPCFDLIGDIRGCLFANNTSDGSTVVFRLSGNATDKNTFLANSGEDATVGTKTFYDVTASCQHNVFIGGHCTAPGAVNGTWITFAANAHSNMVIGTVDITGTVANKQKFVDSSTLGNMYINPNAPRHKYKSGAGVNTIADSDFSFGSTQDDGNLAVIHNTSNGTSRLAVKANGSWKYVTVA